LRTWLTAEKEMDAYLRFLDDHILGVPDFDAYLAKCGGLPRLRELRAQEFLLTGRGC